MACTISLIVTGHNSLVPTIQRFGRYGSECKRVCWSGGGTCTAEGKEGTGGGANIDPGKKGRKLIYSKNDKDDVFFVASN